MTTQAAKTRTPRATLLKCACCGVSVDETEMIGDTCVRCATYGNPACEGCIADGDVLVANGRTMRQAHRMRNTRYTWCGLGYDPSLYVTGPAVANLPLCSRCAISNTHN